MTLRESKFFINEFSKKYDGFINFIFHIVNSFNFITHFTTSEMNSICSYYLEAYHFYWLYENMPYQICYVILWSKNGYKYYWVISKVGSITVQKYHVLSDIHVHVTSGRQSAGCPICLCNLTYKTTLCQTCFL